VRPDTEQNVYLEAATGLVCWTYLQRAERELADSVRRGRRPGRRVGDGNYDRGGQEAAAGQWTS